MRQATDGCTVCVAAWYGLEAEAHDVNCDPIARHYRWLEHAVFGALLERARLYWMGELRQARRVLVLGDGDGRFVAEFAQANRTARIDSLELSQGMLEVAEERLRRSGITSANDGRVSLRRADVEKDDPPGWGYDLVVSHFFLDCFDERAIAQIVERLAPHLDADARWLVTDFRIPQGLVVAAFSRALVAIMYRFFRFATGLETKRLADFPKVFEEAGFVRCAQARLAGGFVVSEIWRRGGSDGSQETARQKEDGLHQVKHAMHGNSDNAEGQQKQPHNGIGDEGEQGQRPGDAEQQAPQQEREHVVLHCQLR